LIAAGYERINGWDRTRFPADRSTAEVEKKVTCPADPYRLAAVAAGKASGK